MENVNKSNPETNDKNNQENNPVNTPSSIKREKAKKKRNTPNYSRQDADEIENHKLSWWTKFLEPGSLWQFITAVITAITLIWVVNSTNRQFRITEKSLTKSDSQTRIALNLTRKADSIAEQALVHSISADFENGILAIKDTLARERNTKTELRAYIIVINFKVEAIKKGFCVFKLFTTNTGKTPAQRVKIHFVYKTGGTGVYENDFKNIEHPQPYHMVSTLGNGITDTSQLIISDPGITTESISEINSGKVVYVYGKINYFDFWGDKHYTRFCYESLPAGQPLIAFHKYYKYNDGD